MNKPRQTLTGVNGVIIIPWSSPQEQDYATFGRGLGFAHH